MFEIKLFEYNIDLRNSKAKSSFEALPHMQPYTIQEGRVRYINTITIGVVSPWTDMTMWPVGIEL